MNKRTVNPGDVVQGKTSKFPLLVEAVYEDGILVKGWPRKIEFDLVEEVPLIMEEDIKRVLPWLSEYKGSGLEIQINDQKRIKLNLHWKSVMPVYCESGRETDEIFEITTLKGLQTWFENMNNEGLTLKFENVPSIPGKPWKCGVCGKEFQEMVPHKHTGGFQKHHLGWRLVFL